MIRYIPGPQSSLDIEVESMRTDGDAIYEVRQGSAALELTHEQAKELWEALIDLWDAEMRRRERRGAM